MTGRLAIAAAGIALGVSAGAPTPVASCARTVILANRDLDHTGTAITKAERAIALTLLHTHGRMNAKQLRATIAELEQLDQAAATILPHGPERRALARAASACLRSAVGSA